MKQTCDNGMFRDSSKSVATVTNRMVINTIAICFLLTICCPIKILLGKMLSFVVNAAKDGTNSLSEMGIFRKP